jgi:hypothetical protein
LNSTVNLRDIDGSHNSRNGCTVQNVLIRPLTCGTALYGTNSETAGLACVLESDLDSLATPAAAILILNDILPAAECISLLELVAICVDGCPGEPNRVGEIVG